MCALSAPIPRGSGLRVQITACAPSISLRPPVLQTTALTSQQGPAGRTDRSRPAAPLDPERYTGAAFDLHPMSSDEDATDFLKLCGSAHQPALSVRWGDFGEGERRCIARWRWHFVISNWILGNRTKRSPDCRNQANGPINQRATGASMTKAAQEKMLSSTNSSKHQTFFKRRAIKAHRPWAARPERVKSVVELRHDVVAGLEVGGDLLHVVIILKRIHQLHQLLHALKVEFGGGGGAPDELGCVGFAQFNL